MTDLYRPNGGQKRTPRLTKRRMGGTWYWCCYGLGAWGSGFTEAEAYQSWVADLEGYSQAVRPQSKSLRGTSD